MKALTTFVLLAAALAGCGGGDVIEGDLIVSAKRVFDGRAVIPDGIVVIRGDEIVAVGRQSEVDASAPKRLALGDATLLPGFVDLHVHGLGQGQLFSPVTTVRDLGAPEAGLGSVRLRRGEPRVLFAGPLLTVPGGYPSIEGLDAGIAGIVTDVADARAAVRRLGHEGASVIKVSIEEGAGDLPILSPAQLSAIVEEAHSLDLPVTAHVSTTDGARLALEAGVDELAHMPCLGEDPTLMRDLVSKGVEIVGTLHVRGRRCRVLEFARTYVRAGGTLLFGSDTGAPGIPPGLDVEELRLMVRAGLSPLDVLTAATARAGEQLGIDKLGTLEKGAPADLVGVDGDPFENLDDLRIPSLLVVRGVVTLEHGRIVARG